MSGFVLHPQALTDLSEIWQYIAADSPSSADRLLDDIEQAVRTLVSFPPPAPTPSFRKKQTDFFFRIRSCECVALQRKKSLFSLCPSP
jgi:plasmid stabilization system protein ParE